MSDEPAPNSLLQLLARWSGGEPLDDRTRLRMICYQPQNGTHAHLHRLYPGLSGEEIAELEAIVGQPVPSRLRTFYEAMNGARLFEQVSVSGLVQNFTRDPAVALSAPISLKQDNRYFATLRPEWHTRGFFRIGAISFLRQDELICGPDDHVVVIHQGTGEPLRNYTDVFACLESFAREMGQFWTDEGIFTGDWAVIDHLLLGVSGTA